MARIKTSEPRVLWKRVSITEPKELSTIESKKRGVVHGSCQPVISAIGKFAIPLILSCGDNSPSKIPSSAHGLKVMVGSS
jgi:hypothetical protein